MVTESAVWRSAFEAAGLDPAPYLGALPDGGRLPWDHIHVGVEPEFLRQELERSRARTRARSSSSANGFTR